MNDDNDDVIDVPEKDPDMNPSIEDRLAYVERRVAWVENDVIAPDGFVRHFATKEDIRSLEYADTIILGCIVCLTVLVWYATRGEGAST